MIYSIKLLFNIFKLNILKSILLIIVLSSIIGTALFYNSTETSKNEIISTVVYKKQNFYMLVDDSDDKIVYIKKSKFDLEKDGYLYKVEADSKFNLFIVSLIFSLFAFIFSFSDGGFEISNAYRDLNLSYIKTFREGKLTYYVLFNRLIKVTENDNFLNTYELRNIIYEYEYNKNIFPIFHGTTKQIRANKIGKLI